MGNNYSAWNLVVDFDGFASASYYFGGGLRVFGLFTTSLAVCGLVILPDFSGV